jgi:hypothetical protein
MKTDKPMKEIPIKKIAGIVPLMSALERARVTAALSRIKKLQMTAKSYDVIINP